MNAVCSSSKQKPQTFLRNYAGFSSSPIISIFRIVSGTPVATYWSQSQRATARHRGKPIGETLFTEEQRSLLIMLVLSRKVGERIHVGDNIVLEIRRIAGNRVTVALEAPRDVRILRGELEGPAKEFRSPEPKATVPAEALATPAHLGVLSGLPAGPVERHFA
jgi:carbon storage regulator